MPVNLIETDTSLSSREILSLPQVRINSLYLHVPFCREKCRYCDFYSLAAQQASDMDIFADLVSAEARLWAGYLDQHPPISTVFFGGGTPSALPRDAMRRLLGNLRETWPIASDAEWSIEANPATIDREYFRMLLEGGVNRLSVGAQSFVDAELRMLGRIHDAEAIRRTVRDAQEAGFRRVSVDLMYAVPGQTLESWQESLEAAISLGISHISCYCLTLEQGTPMWEQTRSGRLPAVAEDAQLQFMRFTRQWLRDHGMPAYEISNYARPGEECRHNLTYWTSGNYVGLGPAAASHLRGRRWRNTPDLRRYLRDVPTRKVPICEVEDLEPAQRAMELVMLMLRLSTGLEWKRFREVAGFDGAPVLQPAVERLVRMGLLRQEAGVICLTDEGCYVADGVIGDLIQAVS